MSRSCLDEYARAIEDKDNDVLEMSHMLKSWNPSALASPYENPGFNLLCLELEGARELVTQLKAMGGVLVAGDLLHQLQSQATNASLTLKLLADSDQCSFGALQQEVDVLESQLSGCEREKEKGQAFGHPGPPLPRGTWPRYFDYYRLYKSYNDLALLKNYEERKMGYGDGSGNVVYKNFMYFNYCSTSDMAKMDLSSNTLVLWRLPPGATYNNRFSYAGVPWKDLDFAGDEKGLWVLYATEESKGNLVVSRLNTSTLEVEKTWRTSQYKPALSGAFMACGVLYALHSLNAHQEEIFYAFDTTTGQERRLSILLDKMLEKLQGINYCPSDHKLYVFNDGYLINYDLTFLTMKTRLPRPPTRRPSGAHAPPKPVKPNKASRP
ncbi:olfactomedin-4-like [Pan troglodytes]|uniref:olfactomedin-4-like n=1 Tax=Pan troglodytes TaxID=9598 RepID=UPI00301323C0